MDYASIHSQLKPTSGTTWRTVIEDDRFRLMDAQPGKMMTTAFDVMPGVNFATCWSWFTVLVLLTSAARAVPPGEDVRGELAVLDSLVGSWVLRPDDQHGFSARQECRWILKNQFLEIDTHVTHAGHVSSWRTLLSYDRTNHCYRQWMFSDKGDVSTAHGAWDESRSTLKLSGSTANGNDLQSSVKVVDDKTLIVTVSEMISNDQRTVVRLTLTRVAPTEDPQPQR